MTESVRYNWVAMIVHWLTALAVICLLVVGNVMADMPRADPLKLDLYNWHKSFGVTVFLLTLFRLVWRLTHRPPALPAEMPVWERRAALLTHWAIYGLLFGVPLLGWVMVSASPHNIPTVLFGTIPLPHLPFLADMELQDKKDYKELFEGMHATAAYVMAGLIVLHIGAALRHRFLLKDQVLQRMLPKLLSLLAMVAGSWALALPAGAAEWVVDPGKSSLGFEGHQSGGRFEGHFKNWQSEITFDPANPAGGHAKVTIDMASAVTGDKQRDSALPDSDWFAAKQSPQAVFEATGFTAKGGNQFEAMGSLMIRGFKKPVILPFTLDISGDTAHASGKLDIVRTDFGVGQGEWADGSIVALAVSVVFDLQASRKM